MFLYVLFSHTTEHKSSPDVFHHFCNKLIIQILLCKMYHVVKQCRHLPRFLSESHRKQPCAAIIIVFVERSF